MATKDLQHSRIPHRGGHVHVDLSGRTCGGLLVFDRYAQILGERFCSVCQLKETYILNRFLIIGKPGAPEAKLAALCMNAGLRLEESLRDRSNQEIIALVVSHAKEHSVADPEVFLRSRIPGEDFERFILAVERKPHRIYEKKIEREDISRKVKK